VGTALAINSTLPGMSGGVSPAGTPASFYNVADAGVDLTASGTPLVQPSFYNVSTAGLNLTDPALAQAMANTGPVTFTQPAWATQSQIAQMQAYVDGANEALLAGALSPTGRVSTAGALSDAAGAAAAAERANAAALGTPYGAMQAGHVPDTTWTGNPQPYTWLPLSPSVNASLGSQATRYPVGFKPTGFYLGD
jgi:hypothetical protein